MASVTLLTGFAIWAAAMLGVAALGGTRRGAQVGAFLAACLLPLPLLVDGGSSRALLAFAVAVGLACAIDFASGPAPAGTAPRLVYIVSFLGLVDTFSPTRRPASLDGRAVARILIASMVAIAASAAWEMSNDFVAPARYLVRYLCAAVLILAAAEIVSHSVRFATSAFGLTVRPVHESPHLSRSVGEFWSRRWNPATARWLRRHSFLPLARRGAVVALFATFAASALLHIYLLSFAADPSALVSWGVFFLAQPVAILTEKRMNVRRWPPVAARVWTFSALLALSPLLFGPALHVLHLTL